MTFFDIVEKEQVFSFDLETYSSSYQHSEYALVPQLGKIRLIALACGNSSLAIDLGYNYELLTEELKEKLRRLTSFMQNKNIVKVVHNAMFDLPFWAIFARDYLCLEIPNYNNIIDTQLCSQWIWAGIDYTSGFSHSLAHLAKRVLNIDLPDKALQKSDFGSFILAKEQTDYAKKDADLTLKIYKQIKDQFLSTQPQYLAFLKLVNNTIPVFVDMMLRGFPADINLIEKNYNAHKEKMLELTDIFKKIYPALEITSVTHKVAEYILSVYPEASSYITRKSKKDLPMVDKKEVAIIANHFNCEGLQAYLLAKSLNKRLSVYEQFISCYSNGVVYSTFRLAANSATGRVSSGQIGGIFGSNQQNHPRPYEENHPLYECGNIRDCLRAPEGFKLIICDYSSAHSRIAAELSQDEMLIRAYKENLDIHCLTAANLVLSFDFLNTSIPEDWKIGDLDTRYNKIVEAYKSNDALAKKLRNYSKTTFYLALNFGGKKRLFDTFLGEVSLAQCEIILANFWATYSGLYSFCRNLPNLTKKVSTAINGVYYKTYRMPTGLNRYFRLWDGEYGQQVKINDLVSSQWLLCEGVAMFSAMTNIYNTFKSNSHWLARLVTVNHDEIVCMCSEEYALDVASFVQEAMDRGMSRWVKSFPATETKEVNDLIARCWSDK